MPLVLASSSPRRKQLLTEHGFDFEVDPPRAEEPPPDGHRDAAAYAVLVAEQKALEVAGRNRDRVVLAADTVVALQDDIFGKPRDHNHARQLLESLGGTTHQVITGVAVICTNTGKKRTRHAVTEVTMRRMAERELHAYLQSGAWRGKAGAYGIQDENDALVESIRGSFTNVVGLPMELIPGLLEEAGYKA